MSMDAPRQPATTAPALPGGTSTGGGGVGRWILLGAFVLAAALGVVWYLKTAKAAAAAAAAQAADAQARPVPVVVAPVVQKDVPIYLEGLGYATPLNTTTVKTQVDGRMDQVFFKEGQKVKKGDLLALIDPRPFQIQLLNAQAALARDQAQLKNAKLNRDRYLTLRGEHLIAEQQYTDQQAMVDQNDATVKTDEAAVATAKLNIDYAHITSPIDGVTGVRLVDPGNIVHAADVGGIVILTQLDPMDVLFTLPEDDLPRISKQMAGGVIPIDAFNRDGTQKLASGKLALVDNEINQTTATIRLKALFPNPDNALWPNAFVKARMLLTTQTNAIVIPGAGLNRGPQGTYCYVVGADNVISLRNVEVDTTQGEFTLIKSGLAVGEQVVIDGQSQIRPGSKVTPRSQDNPQQKASPATASVPSSSGAAPSTAGRAP